MIEFKEQSSVAVKAMLEYLYIGDYISVVEKDGHDGAMLK